MTTVTRSRTIARPRSEVWAALADFAAIGDWAPDVDHSCLLRNGDGGDSDSGDGVAVALGTERRIQTGRTTLVERVITAEDPGVLAYTIEGLPPVVRSVTNEWRLTDEGASGTVAVLTSTVDCGPRPPQQLVARLVGRRLARASDSMLAGLAHTLEGATHA